MKIFILCAGEQTRWAGATLKQFLFINGEPLIKRTLRLLDKWEDVFIVSQHNEFKDLGAKVIKPILRNSTSETALSCIDHLEDKNIFLFGDVYYTEETIKKILNSNGLEFFSDGQDLFAVSVPFGSIEYFNEALLKAIGTGNNNGRIWEAYRAMFGIDTYPMFEGCGQPFITYIGDETQDFDTEEDYTNYLKGISKNIIYGKLQKENS